MLQKQDIDRCQDMVEHEITHRDLPPDQLQMAALALQLLEEIRRLRVQLILASRKLAVSTNNS